VKRAASLSRRTIALYVATVLLACVCVVGGVMAWRTHENRERAQAEQERYGDVLAAATDEAESPRVPPASSRSSTPPRRRAC
jgi:Mce-associated membrane protein